MVSVWRVRAFKARALKEDGLFLDGGRIAIIPLVNERPVAQEGEQTPSIFADSPRVIYKKNPLINVTCQLRFPAILRVDLELPARFQEQVRSEYPIYQEQLGPFQPVAPAEASPAVAGQLSFTAKRVTNHNFVSADRAWFLGLTRDSIALTTPSYTRWEDFLEHLRLPVLALRECYAPAFFTRIGLRYQDLIQRSKLGLSDQPWSALLKPHIAGALGVSELAPRISGMLTQLQIDLVPGRLTINHGLAEVQDKEECYLIDNDFYIEQQTDVDACFPILQDFNKQSGRLFRSCINERLHVAMEPSPA